MSSRRQLLAMALGLVLLTAVASSALSIMWWRYNHAVSRLDYARSKAASAMLADGMFGGGKSSRFRIARAELTNLRSATPQSLRRATIFYAYIRDEAAPGGGPVGGAIFVKWIAGRAVADGVRLTARGKRRSLDFHIPRVNTEVNSILASRTVVFTCVAGINASMHKLAWIHAAARDHTLRVALTRGGRAISDAVVPNRVVCRLPGHS